MNARKDDFFWKHDTQKKKNKTLSGCSVLVLPSTSLIPFLQEIKLNQNINNIMIYIEGNLIDSFLLSIPGPLCESYMTI